VIFQAETESVTDSRRRLIDFAMSSNFLIVLGAEQFIAPLDGRDCDGWRMRQGMTQI
jgi:hypothetical protein